jgi:hypothetical protein
MNLALNGSYEEACMRYVKRCGGKAQALLDWSQRPDMNDDSTVASKVMHTSVGLVQAKPWALTAYQSASLYLGWWSSPGSDQRYSTKVTISSRGARSEWSVLTGWALSA